MSTTLTARMTQPVLMIDGAMEALHALSKAVSRARIGINSEIVHLRASQINGCGVCTDMHAKALRKAGESEERVWSIAAWREPPYFTDAERVALELTEELTRIADRPDPISDELFERCREHFDEQQLA